MRKNTYARTWGLKRREGVCSKGCTLCPVMPTDVCWDLGLPLHYPIPCCHGAKSPYCPSHPTVPWDAINGLGYIPKCSICYTLFHPIPLYHGMEWTDWDTYQSVPFGTPCPYCPSHPTVPWKRMETREKTKPTAQINNFRCYVAKIEESEKASSRRESNPEHL